MKTRSSLNKASGRENSEEFYAKECDQMLFIQGQELIIKGNQVYLKSDNKESLLFKIGKPKTQWYEIWLYLSGIRV